MRAAGEYAERPALGPILRDAMEGRGGQAEATRVAADLVHRKQRNITVKRGVLGALGHDRTGDLLEFHGELEHGSADIAAATLSEIEREHAMDEVEDRRVRARPALFRLRHRPVYVAPILAGRGGAVDIGAVDRKGGDDLVERAAHAVQGEIAAAPMAARQRVELLREDIGLAREIDVGDAALAGIEHRVEAFGAPGEPAISAQQLPLAIRVD